MNCNVMARSKQKHHFKIRFPENLNILNFLTVILESSFYSILHLANVYKAPNVIIQILCLTTLTCCYWGEIFPHLITTSRNCRAFKCVNY